MLKVLYIKIIPMTGHSFKLAEDFHYKDIIVPEGFISNGANIPKLFWMIVPPNYMGILGAVVVHDYLCSLCKYKKADAYFSEMLAFTDINKFQLKTLVYGVACYSNIIRPILIKYGMHNRDGVI